MVTTKESSNVHQLIHMSASFLIGMAAIGNLAFAQIHISVITRVFIQEIGFYFFLFIIFGLVTFMNVLNLQKKNKNSFNAIILSIFACLVTIFGYIYVQMIFTDIETSTILAFKDVALTIYVTMASIACYGLGSLSIIATQKLAKKGRL